MPKNAQTTTQLYSSHTLLRATHSSVLAWRIPGMGEPGGLPSMGSHRVGHDWSDLAAAATSGQFPVVCSILYTWTSPPITWMHHLGHGSFSPLLQCRCPRWAPWHRPAVNCWILPEEQTHEQNEWLVVFSDEVLGVVHYAAIHSWHTCPVSKNSTTKIYCKTIEHVMQPQEYQMHTEIMHTGGRKGSNLYWDLAATTIVPLSKC